MAEVHPKWSHVGLCVSDLDRSMRFYCGGLGFEPAERYELDSRSLPGLAEALEVGDHAEIVSQMITHGALRIELIGWVTPSAGGSPPTRRNQIGLTHLSFWVDDMDATIEALVSAGGSLLEGTRQKPGIDLVFLTDPDGTRVELMSAT